MTKSIRSRGKARNRRKISLRLSGIASSVATAREQVVGFARESGFDDDQLFEIGLAVGEACANAVMHAAPSDASFQVNACDREDTLVITVSDPGEDTVPALARDPDRVGGLGLFLIRRFMDKISLDMSPGGTSLTMSRRKRAA